MRLLPFACALYLGHHLGAEWLTTETGMHGHDEEDVDLVEEGFHFLERRGRIEGQAGTATSITNCAQGFCDVVFRLRFDVNIDGGRAGFDKTRQIMIGVLDHQMHIERKFRLLAHEIDNHRAERNVVDEVTVHDIAMDPIGAGFLDGMDFLGQAREVGGKDGRSDED